MHAFDEGGRTVILAEEIVTLPVRADAPPHCDAATRGFLAGPENASVPAACEWLLGGGGGPVLFCGPSGSGKSHLLRGLTRAWLERSPADIVRYESCWELGEAGGIVAQCTTSADSTEAAWDVCDLVAIDQLELLAGQALLQSQLLSLLDRWQRSGTQVLLASTCWPQQIVGLDASLRSRLIEALVVPLALPGLATRQLLVEQFAVERGNVVPRSVCEQLALDHSHPRLLFGALLRWQAANGQRSASDGSRSTRQVRADSTRHVPIRAIAAVVARNCQVSVADLRSATRRSSVVYARDLAMALARELAHASYQEIGRYFGHRDHTTVLHGCKKITALRTTDGAVRTTYDRLLQHFQGTARPLA